MEMLLENLVGVDAAAPDLIVKDRLGGELGDSSEDISLCSQCKERTPPMCMWV